MLEVAGRPIIYFLLKMLEKAGIRDVIINVHHHPHEIERFLAKTRFLARAHVVREPVILGTAGGVINAIRQFNLLNRPLVVIHGDIACDVDIKPLLDRREYSTLLCAKEHLVEGYVGSVGINERREIVELGRFYSSRQESTAQGFFTGIQSLSADAVNELRGMQADNLVKDVYPLWLKENRTVRGEMLPLIYDDLGTPERVFHINMSIVNGLRFANFDVLDGFAEHPRLPGVFCGSNLSIADEAVLTPPLIIGDDVTIGKGARVGPSVIIGQKSVIDPSASLTKSVIMSGTKVEKDENLHCVIGMSSCRVVVKSEDV